MDAAPDGIVGEGRAERTPLLELAQVTATILIAGSVLFLVGAFLPVARIYVVPSPAEKLAIIGASPGMWRAHLFGMSSGSAVTAVGLTVLVSQLGPPPSATVLGILGAVVLVAGTSFWQRHLYLRVVDLQGFVSDTSPGWHFVAFTALMHVGLLLYGIAFLVGAMPTWLGVMTIGGVALTGTATAIFRDMPPLIYYVFTLTAGLALAW